MEKKCTVSKHSTTLKIKHLVVYCHPNLNSLSGAYKDEIVRITESRCHEVIVRDLYHVDFHPVLSGEDLIAFQHGEIPDDLKVEQDYVRWANLITFIYPVWWTGMPAMIKGYIDRVFSKGFAYTVSEKGEISPLLTGKKVIILNNMGFSYDYYDKMGVLDAMRQTSDKGIFEFCGMEVLAHKFFGHLANSSKEEREGHIRVLELIYSKFLPIVD